MKKLKFSLLQLIVCIGLILLIAYSVINNYHPKTAKITLPQKPGVTIPFTNLKMK